MILNQYSGRQVAEETIIGVRALMVNAMQKLLAKRYVSTAILNRMTMDTLSF